MENDYQLFDWRRYYEVEEEIGQISDPEERQIQLALLERIEQAVTDFSEHRMAYAHACHLRELEERGIRFRPVGKKRVSAQWSRLFAAGVSAEQKKQVYYHQYRWHLFSFEVLPALKGDEARAALNAQPRDRLLLFFQFGQEAFFIENAAQLRAEDLEMDYHMYQVDFYLFDPVARWTYVHTHEEDCGPYFVQL